jgi:hypothetical protein
MGVNPPRGRLAAARQPTQRSDGDEARLWRLGKALAVSFAVAVAGLAGLAGLAWVLLGVAGYRRHGAPALSDTVSVLQLVFATVAGAGALVALIVAYRRQKIAEADSVHDTPCVNLMQRLVLRGLRLRRAGRGRRACG